MQDQKQPAVWFPTIRTDSGTAVFTERLVDGLRQRGLRAEITWLPHRAEFAPWSIPVCEPPSWANITHVNTWLHSRFLPRNIPVVATLHHAIHDPDLKPYKDWLRFRYHKYWMAYIERQTMLRVNCVVAVSQFALDTARRYLLDIPMQLISNGVDVVRFQPPVYRAAHRPFRLLYVGNWAELKGVDLLGPIMENLGNSFELRYTGGADANSASHKLPANTFDIGRLSSESAVADAMQQADALIFPSRSEGFGLVAAEAMACGLPVIATRGSSLPEVVEDGVSGILCNKDDVANFSDAARKLAANPELYKYMAKAARMRAINRFSSEGMVDAYVKIYTRYL